MTYRQQISTKVKRRLYAVADLNCPLCGREMWSLQWGDPPGQPYARATLDHRKPVSKGGTNDPKNLQVICRGCNELKDDQ